jgi:hypothetical protein
LIRRRKLSSANSKSAVFNLMRSAEIVAQIFHLPYRGFSIRNAQAISRACFSAPRRMQFGDTAE